MNQARNHALKRSDYMEKQFGREFKAKNAVAEWIVKNLIDNFQAVLLDTGSTAELVAKELFYHRRYLSILTNNVGAYVQYTNPSLRENNHILPHVESLSNQDRDDLQKAGIGMGLTNGNELLITGGLFNPIHEGLYGQDAITAINNFHPNISIIGVSGLTLEGLYGRGKHDSEVKETILKRPAEQRIAITDWTKIGKTDAHSFGSIADFARLTTKAYIVTNAPPSEDAIDRINKKKWNIKDEQIDELKNKIEKFHTTKKGLHGFEVDATIEFFEVDFSYSSEELLRNYFGNPKLENKITRANGKTKNSQGKKE